MSKKRRTIATRELTYTDGAKQYISGSGLGLSIALALIYAGVSAYMMSVETSAGDGVLAIVRLAAAVVLCVGLICALVGANMRYSPKSIMDIGIIVTAVACAATAVLDIVEVFSEYSVLGFVQQVFQTAMLGSCLVALINLLVTSNDHKINPGVGLLPAVVGVIAVVMLGVRTVLAFASLKSALGSGWNWENAETDLYAELSWVLRTVPTQSPMASKMFYARMIERIAAAALSASVLPALFRFKPFFESFNRQMAYISEIPIYKRRQDEEEREELSLEERYGDVVGIGERRGHRDFSYDEVYDESDDGFDDDIPDEYERRATRRYRDEEEPDERYPQRGQDMRAPQQRYRDEREYPERRRMDGTPLLEDINEMQPTTPDPQNSAQVPLSPDKIKLRAVKPVIPNPDDEDFWNQYKE